MFRDIETIIRSAKNLRKDYIELLMKGHNQLVVDEATQPSPQEASIREGVLLNQIQLDALGFIHIGQVRNRDFYKCNTTYYFLERIDEAHFRVHKNYDNP